MVISSHPSVISPQSVFHTPANLMTCAELTKGLLGVMILDRQVLSSKANCVCCLCVSPILHLDYMLRDIESSMSCTKYRLLTIFRKIIIVNYIVWVTTHSWSSPCRARQNNTTTWMSFHMPNVWIHTTRVHLYDFIVKSMIHEMLYTCSRIAFMHRVAYFLVIPGGWFHECMTLLVLMCH